MWQEYTTAVLGLLVIGVAFLGFDSATLAWTLGILGGMITIVGLWGAGIASPSSGSERKHA